MGPIEIFQSVSDFKGAKLFQIMARERTSEDTAGDTGTLPTKSTSSFSPEVEAGS